MTLENLKTKLFEIFHPVKPKIKPVHQELYDRLMTELNEN